jgi:Na+-driven multidrug efflux pump
MWPHTWAALFSATPAIHVSAASYLCIAGLAYPFLGMGLALSSAFQAAGRPLWPLLGIVVRVLVVGVGGWLVIHATDAGLVGLAFVTAAGLIAYVAIVAIAFLAGAWRPRASGPAAPPL